MLNKRSWFHLPLRFGYYDILLIILLIYGLIIRFNYLGQTFRFDDSYRDYLIGHKIVQDRQFPMIGPWNGSLGFFSSPVYYYVISLTLTIEDNILFLEFVNILFQTLTIALIYVIAKNLFSPSAALIASLLYSFQWVVLHQSFIIWQPFFVQPFLYLSIFLLLLYYLEKNYIFLASGLLFFSLSSVLHNSAFTLLPVYLILAFLIMRFQKCSIWHYFLAVEIFVISLLIFYLPTLVFYIDNGMNIIGDFSSKIPTNPSKVLEDLQNNFLIVTNFNSYFLHQIKDSILFDGALNNLLFLIIIGSALYYFFIHKIDLKRKVILAIILFSILSSFILTTLLQYSSVHTRHFLLLVGLSAIFIGEVIDSTFNKNFFLKIIKIFLIVLLIKSFATNLTDFSLNSSGRSFDSSIQKAAVFAMSNDILDIQKSENLLSPNFFQINLFPNTPETNGYMDVYFWLELEEKFNTKFVRLNDKVAGLGYEQLNEDRYIFLICYSSVLGQNMNTCKEDFLRQYPNYLMVKSTYSKDPYEVYLMKNKLSGV